MNRWKRPFDLMHLTNIITVLFGYFELVNCFEWNKIMLLTKHNKIIAKYRVKI